MVSLLSNATMEILRLPLPLPAFALGSAFSSSGHFHFLSDHGPEADPRSWILLSRGDPFRHFLRRQEALPASLKTPSSLCPALRPRADLHARLLRRFGVAPATSNTKAPPFIIHFEALSHGFTARCLRLKTPFLDANQGSLPVDAQSLSGGTVPAGSR